MSPDLLPAVGETERAEHKRLAWQLIAWKIAYYRPEAVHPSRRADCIVPDDLYDAAEQRYLTLCKRLGFPNTIVHKSYPGLTCAGPGMMEIDDSRPSVQLVLQVLGSPKSASKRGQKPQEK